MVAHRHERLQDQVQAADSPLKLLAVILGKYGLIGAIAAFLIYNLTGKQAAALEHMGQVIQQHVDETHYMQRASCVSLAILAGTPAALCDPPPPPNR